MSQRLSLSKFALAVFTLAVALVGASSLVATEVELTEKAVVEVETAAIAEIAPEQVTFPITPWFAEPANILPGPLGISCCQGSSCTADWQCGGGNQGYCNAPGYCVCL